MTSQPPAPIAIDGPAASGKTTLGRVIAERFGYMFLDTGLMYRAVALAALRAGVPAEDDAAGELLGRIDLKVTAEPGTRIWLDGADVTERLRDPEVEANVSAYAALPQVRAAMVQQQQAIAKRGSAVLAGRDIGTVVLPAAPLKFYLDASPEARARRRSTQAAEWGQSQADDEASRDIGNRDVTDSTRAVSPLRPADDAIVIDTTDLTLEQVIALAMEKLESATPAAAPAPAVKPASAPAGRKIPGLARLKGIGWATFTPPFYWACTNLLRGVLWVVVRWEVTGRERVPREGALIVVSNHLNNADPPIVGAGLARRRIRWMAKIELFKMPFGAFVKIWGAFPVRRFDADLAAMLNAERILKNGGVIGMFPEGTRSRTGYMGTPHPGTAVIALRSGATIIPCAMTGTEKLRNPLVVLRRPKFTFDIGEPIRVEKVRRPTEAQVSELTERMVASISAMLPESYRPPYTGMEGKTPEEPNGRDNPGE